MDTQHFISLEEASMKVQCLEKELISDKICNSLAEVRR